MRVKAWRTKKKRIAHHAYKTSQCSHLRPTHSLWALYFIVAVSNVTAPVGQDGSENAAALTGSCNSCFVPAPRKRWEELGAHLMVSLANALIAAERGCVMTDSHELSRHSLALMSALQLVAESTFSAQS